jgi:hypothetical protein
MFRDPGRSPRDIRLPRRRQDLKQGGVFWKAYPLFPRPVFRPRAACLICALSGWNNWELQHAGSGARRGLLQIVILGRERRTLPKSTNRNRSGPAFLGTFEAPRALRSAAMGKLRTPRWVMSIVPLDLQRRFEQRWAARFSRPLPPAAPEKHPLERHRQQFAAPGKGKRKTRRIEPAGLRSAPAV